MRSLVRSALVGLALAATGCTIHVEQPQITPQTLDFRAIDGQGLHAHVTFQAYNSNTFELRLRELEAELFLEGNSVGSTAQNLGAFTLPPGHWTPVEADVVIPWSGAPGYLMTAMGQPQVRYTMRGQVTVDHYLSVRTSFEQEGVAPREFFLRPAVGAVNNLLNSVVPGLGVQVQ
jgi:LEA14-like dessication related protein